LDYKVSGNCPDVIIFIAFFLSISTLLFPIVQRLPKGDTVADGMNSSFPSQLEKPGYSEAACVSFHVS